MNIERALILLVILEALLIFHLWARPPRRAGFRLITYGKPGYGKTFDPALYYAGGTIHMPPTDEAVTIIDSLLYAPDPR